MAHPEGQRWQHPPISSELAAQVDAELERLRAEADMNDPYATNNISPLKQEVVVFKDNPPPPLDSRFH